MALRTFSDSEMRIIQEVINRVRNSAVGRPAVDSPIRPLGQSAECHVALPKAVIPALSRAPGTGTGTGTSESVEPSEDDEPGYGLCDIYAIQPNDAEGGGGTGTGTGTGDNPPNFSLVYEDQLVYNLSTEDITRDWRVVCKTKFGQWVFVVAEPATENPNNPQFEWEGFLAEELTAPEFGIDTPTGAMVHMYERTESNGGPLRPTGEMRAVWNPDPDMSGPEGAYCRFKGFFDYRTGEYTTLFTYVGCNNALPTTGTGS